jgi:hypothetical protein
LIQTKGLSNPSLHQNFATVHAVFSAFEFSGSPLNPRQVALVHTTFIQLSISLTPKADHSKTFFAVHGMEFGFGAHEYPTSGVFQVEPKSCPGFIFRRSVCVGTTSMSRSEVRTFLEDLAEDYHGDTYHLIVKNCNHFTADICKRLTGKLTPGWVNRLARLGWILSLNSIMSVAPELNGF